MSDPRRAKYVALFASESRSMLATARRALASWLDGSDDRDAPEEIFRALHTIKGMAAALEFTTAADLVHSTETVLSEVRRGERVATLTWLRDFEQSLDTITAACEAAILGAGGASVPGSEKRGGPRVVRVDLDRLDALLDDLGALVITRQELERRAENDELSPVSQAAMVMSRRLDALQERILDVRLAPLSEVLERVPPIVRDLARQLGKDVTVEVTGDALEVDRAVLDQLGEPLLHLLRNAVDHGIESIDARKAAGKRGAGRIVIAARREADTVVLEVSDDGRGIDRVAVERRARDQGIIGRDDTLADDGPFQHSGIRSLEFT